MRNESLSNRHGITSQPHLQLSDENKMLGATCSGLFASNKGLLEAVPSLSKIMSKVFAEQRLVLSNTACSSNDQHLIALDVLESREFEPAGSAALKVPLTGLALGGMPPRRGDRNTRNQQGRSIDDSRLEEMRQLNQRLAYINATLPVLAEKIEKLRNKAEYFDSINDAYGYNSSLQKFREKSSESMSLRVEKIELDNKVGWLRFVLNNGASTSNRRHQ